MLMLYSMPRRLLLMFTLIAMLYADALPVIRCLYALLLLLSLDYYFRATPYFVCHYFRYADKKKMLLFMTLLMLPLPRQLLFRHIDYFATFSSFDAIDALFFAMLLDDAYFAMLSFIYLFLIFFHYY